MIFFPLVWFLLVLGCFGWWILFDFLKGFSGVLFCSLQMDTDKKNWQHGTLSPTKTKVTCPSFLNPVCRVIRSNLSGLRTLPSLVH